LLIIIAYNSLLYLPTSYVFTIIQIKNADNISNSSELLACNFLNDNWTFTINLLDTSNRFVFPTFVMIFTSILLFISMIRIQRRIVGNFFKSRANNSNSMKNQARLLISVILLNISNIAFAFPVSIISLFSFSSFIFIFSLYLLYGAYSCNFYIIFATNSLFRKQFLKLF